MSALPRWTPVVLAALAAAAGGCRHTPTQLIVEITSNLAIPAQADHITLSVTGTSAPQSFTVPLAGMGAQALPLRLTLVPAVDSYRGPVTITGAALLGSATVVSQTLRASFVSGSALRVSVALVQACVGRTCTAGNTCGPDGTCRSSDLAASELVPFVAPDGGTPTPDGGCRSTATEVCNGLDDNCNGMIDEGFDLQSDMNNCGGCGIACGQPHQPGTCSLGRCMPQACEMGYDDCDTTMPGCETQLNSLTHCGSCTVNCTTLHPNTHATYRCDTSTATAACVVGTCDANFANCNTSNDDGCEQSTTELTHCGACGTDCTNMFPGASAMCTAMASGTAMCQRSMCAAGVGDCDSNHSDCETTLNTIANCGGCGVACTRANATATCTGAVGSMSCGLGTCTTGFANCDSMESTGCESELATDSANCGRCGRACTGGSACSGGVCANEVVQELAAGATHTCARVQSGNVYCWGANDQHQLALAATTNVLQPDVTHANFVASTTSPLGTLFLGLQATCVLESDGAMHCVGSNTSGRLGVGMSAATVTAPAVLPAIGTGTPWRSVSMGNAHGCAVNTAGGMYCWGTNGSGALGDGTSGATMRTAPSAANPVAGPGGRTWLSVTSGALHSCALANDNTVWCWGANTSGVGQLGVDPAVVVTSSSTPRQVFEGGVAGMPVLADHLAAGDSFTCASRTSGGTTRVLCWGDNSNQQLGHGVDTTNTWQATPTTGTWAHNITRLSAGGTSVCAQLDDNSVSCWGNNMQGQLALGSSTVQGTPLTIPGATTASLSTVTTLVAVGVQHFCYGNGMSQVLCAGGNINGQLGDNTTNAHATAAPVHNLPY